MKAESAIRYHLKKVIFYHQKRLLKKRMAQRSWNCKFQSEHPKVYTDNGVASACHSCVLMGGACDDTNENQPSRARQCPSFENRHDPDQIKRDYKEFLATATSTQIAYEFPDIYALMWVLEDESPDVSDLTPDPNTPQALVEALSGVERAVSSLRKEVSTKPPVSRKVAELSDRLGSLEDRLGEITTTPVGESAGFFHRFWVLLFGRK